LQILICPKTSLILFSVAHFFAPSKPFIADSSSGSSKYFSTLSFATLIILSNFSFSLFFSAKTFSSSVKKSLSFGKEVIEPEGKIDFD
jgi:hypothetical protein